MAEFPMDTILLHEHFRAALCEVVRDYRDFCSQSKVSAECFLAGVTVAESRAGVVQARERERIADLTARAAALQI